MARARKDIAADIKAANGTELNPETYSAQELQDLLELAKADNQDAFVARLTELEGGQDDDEKPTPTAKTVTVRVSARIAAYGGEFTDPESKRVIGKKPVNVPQTAFVKAKLRTDELIAEE